MSKKELKSKLISIRVKPSLLEALKKRKINRSKFFEEKAEIEIKSKRSFKK